MFCCRGGIFLNQQTQIKRIRVKSRAERLLDKTAELVELPERERTFGMRFLQLDRLVRNFAVVGGLVLVITAVRSSDVPEAQSVFGVLQESAGIQWDESVGKLSFVNSFLPEEIQTVWNETPSISVFAPLNGEIVHAWSQTEPYLLIQSALSDVRASADGEVMSIAHGIGEERILRVRHDDNTETIYGNLQNCYAEIGQYIKSGDIIGTVLPGYPLAFEVRMDGRSINPADGLKTFEE